MDTPHVLVVDDEPAQCRITAALLQQADFSATAATSGEEALKVLEEDVVDLVISDLSMPKMDGIQLLKAVRAAHPRVPVLLQTAYGTISSAVEAMALGAVDYVEKPLDRENLIHRVNKALKVGARPTPATLSASSAFEDIERMARAAAMTKDPVLLLGETGTGKTRLARYIHDNSPRRDETFEELDCSQLKDTLIESELFGHTKGAFTGAISHREGAARKANRGTLFLDEIGDLDPALQTRLLRLIQEQEVRPVGSDHSVPVDVRIVAATKQDITAMMKEGQFRDDLYYRLAVVTLRVPPLRERPGAIRELATTLVKRIGETEHGRIVSFDELALDVLEAHPWPGNIRELENVIRRLLIFVEGDQISAKDVRNYISPDPSRPTSRLDARPEDQEDLDLARVLRQREYELIVRALERTSGTRTEAAGLLGISRRTLYNRIEYLRRHGLVVPSET